MLLSEIIANNELVITEGSIIEIIRRSRPDLLDARLDNSAMIMSQDGRRVLREIYSNYLDVITQSSFPAIVLTPTWRANPERVSAAGYEFKGFNRRAVEFVTDITIRYASGSKILTGGLMGPKNDAYKPEEALTEQEAFGFHRPQASELFNSGVDFILVSTLPALSEALGISKALGHPCLGPHCRRESCNADISAGISCSSYMLSFVLQPDGKLLDGNTLADAIETIDNNTPVPPIGYMAGCTHPDTFISAMKSTDKKYHHRIIGIQANASACSPAELDNSCELLGDGAEKWADSMMKARQLFGSIILGGCCGTDPGYIRTLIQKN